MRSSALLFAAEKGSQVPDFACFYALRCFEMLLPCRTLARERSLRSSVSLPEAVMSETSVGATTLAVSQIRLALLIQLNLIHMHIVIPNFAQCLDEDLLGSYRC